MMNIDYSQFLSMIPEVTLVALLIIIFIADFATAQRVVLPNAESKAVSPRAWFNPLVCLLMAVHIVINIFPVTAATAFGNMYLYNACYRGYQDYSCLGRTHCAHSES